MIMQFVLWSEDQPPTSAQWLTLEELRDALATMAEHAHLIAEGESFSVKRVA
jgi:hypothetical protein